VEENGDNIMVKTNSDIEIYVQAETNYAGGDNAGVKYSQTDPNADDFTRINLLAGDVKWNPKKFERGMIAPPGLLLGTHKVWTKGAIFPDFEFSYHLQTAADPFKADAVDQTNRGGPGTSYIFQVVIPDPEEGGSALVYNIFGAQLKKYVITDSMQADKPVFVTVSFTAYSIVVNGGTVQTAALPSGTLNQWDDVTITLDGDAITELKDYTLTIENIYGSDNSNGRNSSFSKFEPLLSDKTFELQATFLLDSAGIMFDTLTEALRTFTSIWTEGTNTITVTNCHVESDNSLEYPGASVENVEYNVTIVGGESVYS
jgi:hypothetical protein